MTIRTYLIVGSIALLFISFALQENLESQAPLEQKMTKVKKETLVKPETSMKKEVSVSSPAFNDRSSVDSKVSTREYLAQKYNELSQIKNESPVHRPQQIALVLAEVGDQLTERPSDLESFFEFYNKCSSEEKFGPSLRAFCHSKIKDQRFLQFAGQ